MSIVKYTPITALRPIHLPDGSIEYKEFSLDDLGGLGQLGMKDPNRGKKVGGAITAIGGVVTEANPVIGAIIVAAGALITAFSNTKKTQKDNAAAAGYEAANTELQSQNQQLDAKILELQNAIIKAKTAMGVDPSTLTGGLGWCLVNCAKNDAKKRLADAKGLYEQLTQSQEEKIEIIQQLTDEAHRMFLKTTTTNIAYIGVGLLLLGAIGYYVSKKSA